MLKKGVLFEKINLNLKKNKMGGRNSSKVISQAARQLVGDVSIYEMRPFNGISSSLAASSLHCSLALFWKHNSDL